jgi:hypothetical protein
MYKIMLFREFARPLKVGMILPFAVLMWVFYVGMVAFADTWMAPESWETYSDNHAFVFRIIPTNDNHPYAPGNCSGVLYAKNGDELKVRWERPLVNNRCPIKAAVSNSGKYVITFGEWGNYEKLPIVVYGERGRLINVYGDLEQIMSRSYSPLDHGLASGTGLPSSISGRHWLSNSLAFFESNEDFFVVRMSNRETLVFETQSGRLVDEHWKMTNRLFPGAVEKYENLRKNMGRLIILRSLELASSGQSDKRENGLYVLNQCHDRDSRDILKEALRDPTSRVIEQPQGKVREYPIRKAAKEALEMLEEKVPESVIVEERIYRDKK